MDYDMGWSRFSLDRSLWRAPLPLFGNIFRAADVHVLFDGGHRREADVPAADADLEAAVLFRLALGGLQRLSVEDVEVDGQTVAVQVHAQEAPPDGKAFVALHGGGMEHDVQRVVVRIEQRIDGRDGADESREAAAVHAHGRREVFRHLFAVEASVRRGHRLFSEHEILFGAMAGGPPVAAAGVRAAVDEIAQKLRDADGVLIDVRQAVAVLFRAAEDLLASKNAEAIADSEGMKSLKDAAGHLSDAAGILELHAAVDEIVLAAALLPEEAKKGGTDLSSEIKAVYDAAKKTEAALTAANAGAEGFNQKRRKIYNKVLADTMGLSEIETW